MPTLESPLTIALNHVLEGEEWARRRLAAFAGATLEVRLPPLPALRFVVAADGRIAPARAPGEATLVVSFAPGALAAAVQGEESFMRAVQLNGNAQLANELRDLLRYLRWDAEEDLAGLVGDIAAHRLAGLARRALAWNAELARRLGAGALEYAAGDGQLLVARGEFASHRELTARLREDIERLEARLRLSA